MTNHHDVKLDRKELKEPDMFQEKGTATLQFVEKNKGAFFVVLAAITALITGSVIYRNAQDAANEKAASELFPIKKSFDESFKKLTDQDKALPNVFEAKMKKESDALVAFSRTVTAKPVAYETLVTLGNAYYDVKKFEEATAYFDKAVTMAPSVNTEFAAVYSKAYAFENMGKTDDAITLFSKVYSADVNKGLKSDSLMSLARNYETKGDKKKALETLEKFKKDYPDSQSIASVDADIKRLQAVK